MDEAQALEQLASHQGMEGEHPHVHLGSMQHITILDHAQLEQVHQVGLPAAPRLSHTFNTSLGRV